MIKMKNAILILACIAHLSMVKSQDPNKDFKYMDVVIDGSKSIAYIHTQADEMGPEFKSGLTKVRTVRIIKFKDTFKFELMRRAFRFLENLESLGQPEFTYITPIILLQDNVVSWNFFEGKRIHWVRSEDYPELLPIELRRQHSSCSTPLVNKFRGVEYRLINIIDPCGCNKNSIDEELENCEVYDGDLVIDDFRRFSGLTRLVAVNGKIIVKNEQLQDLNVLSRLQRITSWDPKRRIDIELPKNSKMTRPEFVSLQKDVVADLVYRSSDNFHHVYPFLMKNKLKAANHQSDIINSFKLEFVCNTDSTINQQEIDPEIHECEATGNITFDGSASINDQKRVSDLLHLITSAKTITIKNWKFESFADLQYIRKIDTLRIINSLRLRTIELGLLEAKEIVIENSPSLCDTLLNVYMSNLRVFSKKGVVKHDCRTDNRLRAARSLYFDILLLSIQLLICRTIIVNHLKHILYFWRWRKIKDESGLGRKLVYTKIKGIFRQEGLDDVLSESSQYSAREPSSESISVRLAPK